VRPNHGALAELPEATEQAMDDAALGVVRAQWRDLSLGYDWNPLRIAWRGSQRRYRITRFGSFLVLQCPGSEDGTFSTLLGGRGSGDDLATAMAGHTMLRADPATAEHALDIGTGVAVFSARGFDEYLYDLPEQLALQGKRFGRRRTYLRSLERDAGSVELTDLDLESAHDASAVAWLYDSWSDVHGSEASVEDERAALQVLLDGGGREVRAAGLRIDGNLAGFGVYDLLADGVATAHFVKARRSSAETAATWQAVFASAHRAGASTLNGGYDGGLKGLRAAKSGLRPQKMREALFVVAG
jgi:hypothetical protein